MKYAAIISHSLIIQYEAEDYKEAVKKAIDAADDLRERTSIPYVVEQVQKEDDLYPGVRQ